MTKKKVLLTWVECGSNHCCITHVISHIALRPQVLDNEAKLDICVPYKQQIVELNIYQTAPPFWGKKIRYLFGCGQNDIGKNVTLYRISHNCTIPCNLP